MNRLEGGFSVEAVVAHYQALVSQEQHLNTRYLNQTDTEATLLARLKRLQQDLSGLVAGYIDSAELSRQLQQGAALGPTQNLIRARVDEKADGTNPEQENIARSELLQGYFLLFFLEIREKVTSVLEQLNSWATEGDLVPSLSRITHSESLYGLSWAEEAIGLNSTLHRLYNEVSTLKLNITAQDLRSLAAAPASTLHTFSQMLEIAGLHFADKLKRVITDLSRIFTKLAEKSRSTETELDSLALSEAQLQAYKSKLPSPLEYPTDTKISDMAKDLLEYRLTHAPVQTSPSVCQVDFRTFITQYSQQTHERKSRDFVTFLDSPKHSSSFVSEYSRLLRPNADSSKSSLKKLHISYEQELLNEVSETESRIKSIEDRSNFHTERLTTRMEAALHESSI